MKRIISVTAVVLAVVIVLSSCTNSRMVSCPDYSSDRSVLVSNGKSYKAVKYKSSKSKDNTRKIKSIRSHSVQLTQENSPTPLNDIFSNILPISSPLLAELEIRPLAIAIKNPIQTLNLDQALKQAQERVFVSANVGNSVSMPLDRLNTQNINAEATSMRDVLPETTLPLSIPMIKKAKKIKKSPLRYWISTFRASVTEIWKNKPAMGLALISLACALSGLLIAGLPLGICAVLFASSALGRLKVEPGQAGKGIAIAGMVVGIMDIVLILLLLAAM